MRFVHYHDLASPQRVQLGVEVFGVIYDLAALIEQGATITGLPALPVPDSLWDYTALSSDDRARLVDLVGAVGQFTPEQRAPLLRQQVQRVSPVPQPRSLRCFAAFEDHVRVTRQRRGLDMPTEWYENPAFFFGNHTAVYGHGAKVPQPASFWLDFEMQVACVIGRTGRNIQAKDAEQYIAGYTILNDWCARDLEMYELRRGFGLAKGRDFAFSLGPTLVTPDELEPFSLGEGVHRRYDLSMAVTINDRPLLGLMSSSARDMHFTFPQLIEHASSDVTLYPGDILASGAVNGGSLLAMGAEETFGRWLQVGDVVDIEVEGLGVLRNIIGLLDE